MAFCQSCGAQMSEGATVCTACGEAKSGRPYGSTPGMTPPSQYAPTATGVEVRGFLSSLFDLSFTSFITTKLIKVLYVLSLLGAALIALSVGVSGFNAGSTTGLITLIIVAPITFLFGVIYCRVMMELVIVVFRAAEHVAEIARQGRTAS